MEFYESSKKRIVTALDEVVYKLNNKYSFVKNDEEPYMEISFDSPEEDEPLRGISLN